MSEAQRRRRLDELTVWLLNNPGPPGQRMPVLNCAALGLPAFTVLVPGAYAYTIGGPDVMRRVADLLGAFTTGDVDRAAALMGSPPPSAS